MPQLDCFSSDHAGYRGIDFRVAEVKLRGVYIGASLLQVASGRVRLGACVGDVLRSNTRGLDLRLALNNETACFGDPLFRPANGRPSFFYSLSRLNPLGLTIVAIGA